MFKFLTQALLGIFVFGLSLFPVDDAYRVATGSGLAYAAPARSAMPIGPASTRVCDFEGLAGLENVDLSAAVTSVQPLHGQSAEGGQATVSRLGVEVVFIKVSLYGETGRTDITYYRDHGDREAYFVVFKTVRYTAPISVAGTRIASESVDRFTLCGDEDLNYPGAHDVARAYQVSVDILQLIEH
ncbi:MAG: hypothetical protein KUG59_07215 [Parvibaculaceae bacterium]|nr:hypothetical protein [Parvibaculaceae bacterium]